MSKALDIYDLPLSGKFLIEAGAGTGKTYNITSLYLRVLIEQKLMPKQVLVLTFTNDATNELKQRLRARIQEVLDVYAGKNSTDDFIMTCATNLNQEQRAHLQQCLYAFDEAAVSTIHGFCQRLLSENAIDFEVSTNFDLLTDELSLLTEATDAFWIDFFFNNPGESDFERWYISFFEEVFKAPEDFIKKYAEILLNPDLDISACKNPIEVFEKHYEQAASALENLKISVDEFEDELRDLFDNGPLSGTYYKKKPEMVIEFIGVVRSSTQPGLVYNNAEAAADKVEERFIKFGNYIHDHLLKNKTIDQLSLFDRVDEFYAANRTLLQIKEVFLYQSVTEIRDRFAKLKRNRNLIGYNDLLVMVRDTFIRKPNLASDIKRRYPVAFIDEFQDTDHIQFSIFQQIYEKAGNIFWVMIGDPKQAIYRFRGADIKTYLYAKKGVADENHRTLLHNYRSSESLINGVNAFFNQSKNPFGMEGLNFENAIYPKNKSNSSLLTNNDKSVTPVTVVEFEQKGMSVGDLKSEVMDSVCSEIISLLKSDYKIDDRPISIADIAILVDKHVHANELQEKLSERGLKSIIRSKVSVYQTQEADDLYRILRAVSEFENERYIRAAMLTRCLGYNSDSIIELFKSDDISNDIIRRFTDLHEIWQKDGFSKFINRLLVEFQIEEQLAISDQPERALTNLYHLRELLVREVRSQALGMQSTLRYFQEKRENPNTDNDAEIIRLESDGDLIQIVTHHSSKGLEYPIVFCPFLWDMKKSYPDFVVHSDGKSTKVIFKNDSEEYNIAKSEYELDELSEQKRLTYVALTRAELKCFVYLPASIKVDRAKGSNIIGSLWEENTVSQLVETPEIEVKALELKDEIFSPAGSKSGSILKTASFSRSDIWEYPRVVSYSSISSEKHSTYDESDYKDTDPVEKASKEEDLKDAVDSVFSLPKGKNTGNLVHSIFEDIDFDDPANHTDIILKNMDSFNIDKKWEKAVNELVKRSLNVILKDQVKLNDIAKVDKLVEMEFYIPIHGLSRLELLTTLGKVGELNNEQISGYLKGFIDLIFRVGTTYYILDYKTNHLGSTFEDYSTDALKDEMKSSNYDIQYHLYTLALHRYLSTRIPEYEYSKHFGGVFYLFVRGVNPSVATSGVFFDKPDKTIIDKLDSLIREIPA